MDNLKQPKITTGSKLRMNIFEKEILCVNNTFNTPSS